jgi:carboxyl-terminal processing protease
MAARAWSVPSSWAPCLVAAALVCAVPPPAAAQGMRFGPSDVVRPGSPLLSVDTDEEAQAARVFKSPRWRAFVETMAREAMSPPEPATLDTACRRSIHMARLTSHELLVDGCITEALERVDPMASYIAPRQFAASQRERRRPTGAMGLELPATKRAGEPISVVTALDNGPAARAGILAGDQIEAIDGVRTAPLSQDDALDVLRGEPGTIAHMQVMRAGTLLELPVVRRAVTVRSINVKRLGDDVLYLRIARFRPNGVADALFAELRDALTVSPRPKRWVVDLRHNPGGALGEVVQTASLFLPDATPAFSVASRVGVRPQVPTPPPDAAAWKAVGRALAGIPLVVMVDSFTAGGAEALAHLLREHLSAKVAGEPSPGADNVLTGFDLLDQAAVQITVGYIVAPSGQRQFAGSVPLDLPVATTPRTEFGELPGDGALAATLQHFAN